MNNNECEYVKTKGGYVTSCGYVVTHIGRFWYYCPFCGKQMLIPPRRGRGAKKTRI